VTPRRTPGDEQLREAFGEVGDALQRALVLSSDRVQSVLEDAVLRGRMTRRDAEELATHLVTLGREQALELRTALAKSVGDTVASAGEVVASAGEAVASAGEAVATAVPALPKKRRAKASTNGAAPHHDEDADAAAVARLRKAATTSDVPADAASRSAKELIDLASTLSTSELWALRELEAAGKARATVLQAIDRKLDR
jgi:hypothetical protein